MLAGDLRVDAALQVDQLSMVMVLVITGVGVIAYQLMLPPVSGSGPGVEIGWLSASHRLMDGSRLSSARIKANSATPANIRSLRHQCDSSESATSAALSTWSR